MSALDKIERAFSRRSMPTNFVQVKEPITPEQKDALRLAGRDWHDLTWDDWSRNPDAIYAFTPEAFTYYLPSVLSVTAINRDRWLSVADALLQMLDRSPEVYQWDLFMTKRLLGLQPEEYEVIKEWLLSLSGCCFVSEDALVRSFETVDLLERETERVRRNLVGKR